MSSHQEQIVAPLAVPEQCTCEWKESVGAYRNNSYQRAFFRVLVDREPSSSAIAESMSTTGLRYGAISFRRDFLR
jgi:hypothetical protein